MIKVKTCKKDNQILEVSITGHANYNDYGQDIVCAAVSATGLCTVNAILLIDASSIKYIIKEGTLKITIYKDEQIINKLIENMLNCLKSIEKDYPNNIQIKEEKR